uniref:Uncharacterized protein n=1 Tax=Sparus aurata TaxID=8175 RepID=A0A671TQN9_SPAAU
VAATTSCQVLPSARCLFDEPFQVKVGGLRVGQMVTVKAASTDERGVVFSSSATYRADGDGEIDLDRDPSLSGSYVGVEPMGLLWSLRTDTLHWYFFKNKVVEPMVVKLSVHEGEGEGDGRMLAEVTNERFLIGDGVSRLPIKEGNVQGVLFTPPEGPFPAVLDLCTFMSEKRASLLANKGFVVLAVEKSTLILQHFVSHRWTAVVWINGCSANVGFPLYYKKRQILSPLLYDFSKVIPTESGARIVKCCVKNPLAEENKGSLIPIQQAKAHFLFVVSEDDLNWDSKGYVDEMVQRLKHHGKDNFETVCYPGAGHLLEPPYGPYCPSTFHGLVRYPVLWGGEPRAHAVAEVHMWKKVQEFLRTHLSCEETKTKAML